MLVNTNKHFWHHYWGNLVVMLRSVNNAPQLLGVPTYLTHHLDCKVSTLRFHQLSKTKLGLTLVPLKVEGCRCASWLWEIQDGIYNTQSWTTSTSQTWSTQSSMEPLNRREPWWFADLQEDLQSSRSSSCLGVAPHKTYTSILVRSFIFHNLATSEGWGMQICISMLKGAKIMESKAPNLEERAPLSDVLYIPWSCYLWESMTQGCYLWGSRDADLHLDAQG